MGHSWKKFDKDEEYFDVKSARKNEKNFRKQRHQKDDVEPTSYEEWLEQQNK